MSFDPSAFETHVSGLTAASIEAAACACAHGLIDSDGLEFYARLWLANVLTRPLRIPDFPLPSVRRVVS